MGEEKKVEAMGLGEPRASSERRFGARLSVRFDSRFFCASLACDSELPVLSLRSDCSRDRTAAKLKILFLGGLRCPRAENSRLSER